jgi:endonuclease/exonuclease/phosphatase family metal-dependent hydrolase
MTTASDAPALETADPTVEVATVRVATWNIHDAVGCDGQRDWARVARVIQSLGAPIVGLQEVACGSGDACDVQRLAAATGCVWRAIPTRGHAEVQRGNALLTSLPVLATRVHDLSIAGREPRAALEVDLRCGDRCVRVVVTHLGLRAGERRRQVARLLAFVRDENVDATLLLGDINEWFMWGRPLRWLHRRFGVHPGPRTFPARLPLLALDRIWAHPDQSLSQIAAVRTGEARVASDHLPVVATLRLPARRPAVKG